MKTKLDNLNKQIKKYERKTNNPFIQNHTLNSYNNELQTLKEERKILVREMKLDLIGV